jgi:hypothetical protein
MDLQDLLQDRFKETITETERHPVMVIATLFEVTELDNNGADVCVYIVA